MSWSVRAQDEGAKVLHYIFQPWQQEVGTNLVPKTNSLHEAFAWAKANNAMVVYLSSGMGVRGKTLNGRMVPVGADDFRKAGLTVVGGGAFCDNLENDREFGEQVAKQIGCRVPPTKTFSTIAQAIAFARTVGDEGWYFKSDKYLESDATYGGKNSEDLVRYLESIQRKFGNAIPNMLQQKIPGVALSTACWWNGRSFVPPFESTIEHKKFMDGDIGPSTGAAFNVVWFYESESPKVVQSIKWQNLTPVFQKNQAPPGLYDINVIIAEEDGPWGPAGEAYFLEHTPRCGWDSEATSHRLLETTMPDFLEKLTAGRLAQAPFSTKDLALSTRLSVTPYPFEHYADDKQSAKGTPIHGADGLWDGHFVCYSVAMNDEADLYVADRWGLVGLTLAVGRNVEKLQEETMAFVKDELQVPSLQYRTDCAKCVTKDAKRIAKLGFEVPKGLLAG